MKKVYPFLLGALMATLIASPISAMMGRSGDLIEVCLLASLALAVFGAAATQRRWLLLILASAVTFKVIGIFLANETTGVVGSAIVICLAALAAPRLVGRNFLRAVPGAPHRDRRGHARSRLPGLHGFHGVRPGVHRSREYPCRMVAQVSG